MRYITGRARTKWETRSRLKKDIGLHHEFGFGLCLGLLRETGEVVGRYGLEPRPSKDGLDGELAWMTKPKFRGNGPALEAARALITFGAQDLGLRRIFAVTARENSASMRVMERLGLRLEREDLEELRFVVDDLGPGPL